MRKSALGILFLFAIGVLAGCSNDAGVVESNPTSTYTTTKGKSGAKESEVGLKAPSTSPSQANGG
jgi:hypothetical protein